MDVNVTAIPLIEPLVNTVKYFVNIVQLLVGGIFGLYLILVFLRWREAREMRKLMKGVKNELKNLHIAIEGLKGKTVPKKKKAKK